MDTDSLFPLTPDDRPTTILCVEDDPDVTWALRQYFKAYHVELKCCVQGFQGMWTAARWRPDVILTDLRMESGGGEHLLVLLKDNPATARIPVIVLTGQPGEHLPARMKRLGADGFLRKPIHFAAVISEIRRFADLAPLPDEWPAAAHGPR